jgi:predicted nucleotidyltransferase
MSREEINSLIVSTLESYGVKKIAVFGSYARGENLPGSDIDILVEFLNPIGLFEFVNIKQELELKLNKSVDLLTYNSIYHRLRDTILAEQKMLYEIK